MASVNKVIILGNLGRDPEVRHTNDGTAIANVTVATSRRYKDSNGQPQEEATWHHIVFFGRLAEIVSEYLKKGSQVYIEGRLRVRKWQGQDGQDRYATEIVAESMQMLSSRERSEGSNAQPQHTQATQSFESAPRHQARQQQSYGYDKSSYAAPQRGGVDDEEIPF